MALQQELSKEAEQVHCEGGSYQGEVSMDLWPNMRQDVLLSLPPLLSLSLSLSSSVILSLSSSSV